MKRHHCKRINVIIFIIVITVHTRKKLVHERQFARAPSFVLVIALTYLDLHVQSKICVSAEESFLLLKHVKYFI